MGSKHHDESSLSGYRQAPDQDKRAKIQELIRTLSPDRAPHLIQYLVDPDENIRAEAFYGLSLIPSAEVASQLIPLLSQHDLQIKNLVIELLSRYGKEAVRGLAAYLSHPDKQLRKLSLDLLGKIGDSAQWEQIVPLLADSEPMVAVAAAEALGHLRAAEAVPALIRYFDIYPEMPPVAIIALGRCRSLEAERFLVEVIHRRNNILTMLVLDVLESSHHPETAQSLLQILPLIPERFHPRLMKTVCCILKNMKKPAETYLDFEGHEKLVFQLLQTDRRETFQAVFHCLSDSFLLAHFSELLKLLEKPNAEISLILLSRLKTINIERLLEYIQANVEEISVDSQRALMHLLDECDPACIQQLLKILSGSKEPTIRTMVAQTAAVYSDHNAFESILLRLTNDPEPSVKKAAYLALCEHPHQALLPVFIQGLQTLDFAICDACIHALSILQPDIIQEEVQKLMADGQVERLNLILTILSRYPQCAPQKHAVDLFNHPDATIRKAAIYAFSNVDDFHIQKLIEQKQKDSEPDVRLHAFYVLAQGPPERALAAITQALKDENYEVQLAAIEATRFFHFNELVPYLYPLLESSDRRVQVKAVQALIHLLGELGKDEVERHLAEMGEEPNTILSIAMQENEEDILTNETV